MMRKYINRNYPDFTAEQRADGNYNLKKKGSYGYTIRIAKDIENNEDWDRIVTPKEVIQYYASSTGNCFPTKEMIERQNNFFKTVLDNVDSVKDAHTTDDMYVSAEECLRYHENRAFPPAKNNKTKTAMKCKHCNKELNNTLIDILLHEEGCIEIAPSNNT